MVILMTLLACLLSIVISLFGFRYMNIHGKYDFLDADRLVVIFLLIPFINIILLFTWITIYNLEHHRGSTPTLKHTIS